MDSYMCLKGILENFRDMEKLYEGPIISQEEAFKDAEEKGVDFNRYVRYQITTIKKSYRNPQADIEVPQKVDIQRHFVNYFFSKIHPLLAESNDLDSDELNKAKEILNQQEDT